jgi:Mg2+ and Co2+ transporter CorA
MRVSFVHGDGISDHAPGELEALLQREDGFVWVDIPALDSESEAVLMSRFGCHSRVVESCGMRNHLPTVHGYQDHVFVVLHAPLAGASGHVHLLELDQIVGRHYLITVHGPLNPAVDPAQAMEESNAVYQRIVVGRFRPTSPAELSYALGTALARRQRALVGAVAERLPELEQEAMEGDFRRPEDLLDKLFLIRHELITVRTMAAQSHDVCARLASLERFVPESDRPYARDLTEQFERVRSIADGENQFLFGVIDLYSTRATTKMTVAMERLAVIAAVTLPITALASVYGMNVIVNYETDFPHLFLLIAVMALISGALLRWTKRQGWW